MNSSNNKNLIYLIVASWLMILFDVIQLSNCRRLTVLLFVLKRCYSPFSSQSQLSHIGESRMEMDYRLVENEGLFQEYLEMGELLLYSSIFFPVTLDLPRSFFVGTKDFAFSFNALEFLWPRHC